jgi:hypothetical protein
MDPLDYRNNGGTHWSESCESSRNQSDVASWIFGIVAFLTLIGIVIGMEIISEGINVI